MRRLLVSFFSFAVLMGSMAGFAQASPADHLGERSFANDVASLEDGSTLVSGVNFEFRSFVLRLTPRGVLDPSFGREGLVTKGLVKTAYRTGMLVQPDGKILIWTSTWGTRAPVLTRLEADGSKDESFGNGGALAIDDLASVGVQADGKILIAGNDFDCFDACPTGAAFILRLNPDGSVDQSFGTAGRANLRPDTGQNGIDRVTTDASGRIVASQLGWVLRLTADGNPDPSFDGDGYASSGDIRGSHLNVSGTKIIIAGGLGEDQISSEIRRFNDDGSPDTGFGQQGIATPQGELARHPFFFSATNGKLGLVSGPPDSCFTATGCKSVSLGYLDNAGQPILWPGGSPSVSTELGYFSSPGGATALADGKTVVSAQKVVVAGWDPVAKVSTLRYSSDGSLDRSFGTDGIATVPAIKCFGQEARFSGSKPEFARNGTKRPDVIMGSWSADRIHGYASGDRLCGKKGQDRLYGGKGPDLIAGGPGRDLLSGGPGNDRILARDGYRDVVRCGAGRKDVAIVDRKDVVRGCEKVKRPGRK